MRATFNIRIPADLKAKAFEAAAKDGRTLSGLVIKLLNDYVRKQAGRA